MKRVAQSPPAPLGWHDVAGAGHNGALGWESSDGRLAPGAEWYASAVKWSVFPCWGIAEGKCACGGAHREAKDWGKHPHGRLLGGDGGYKAATNDVETVRNWWSSDPDANVALACRPSGILVLDADPRHGGDMSLETLEKEIGGLPATVEAVTGEYTLKGRVVRGRHVLLKVDPSLELVGKLRDLPGIDIKWNGYVLITPSRHGSGIVYQWAAGRAPWEHGIADAPPELLELLVRKGSGSLSPGGSGSGSGGGYGTLDWAGEKLDVDAILEAGIPDGERMVTMYKLACAFANQYPVNTEHGRLSVMRVMHEINSQRVFPPMGWGDGGPDDVKPHIERAIEFVKENPKATRASMSLSPELGDWIARQAEETAGRGGGVTGTSGGGGASDTLLGVVTPLIDTVAGGAAGGGSGGSGGAMLMPGGGEGGMGDGALPPDLDGDPGNDGNGATIRRSLSDIGNAARLIDHYARVVKYTEGAGWFVWDPGNDGSNGGRQTDGYWAPDPGGAATKEKAKALSVLVVSEMVRLGLDPSDEQSRQYVAHSNSCRKDSTLNSAMSLWKVDSGWTRVPAATWDANPHLLGVSNGAVDLKTGALLPGRPEQFITRRAQVSYTPGLRNMRWEEFLNQATGGDKELQDWLQKAAGYTLTGLCDLDALFLVFGPPGSGKSTFLDALGTVMGDYYWMLPASVMVDNRGMGGSDEYYWAELRGRRMVVMSEFPESKNIKEDAIKRLTGDAIISGRSPGEKPIKFNSQAKLWVGTNHLPIIKDEAMWRRIRAIPFRYVPERPDSSLREYLKDPDGGLPAVVSWAVEGAVKLLSASSGQPLGMCAAVSEASAEYRKNEDRLGIFLENEFVLEEGAVTGVPDFYSVYVRWCDDRGEKPMSLTALMKRVRERGAAVSVTGTGSRRDTVEGIKVRSDGAPQTEDWATITTMASRRYR